MTPSDALQLPWQLLVSAAVAALLLALLIWRKIRRATRNSRGDEVFGQVVMVVALAWSADVMWNIARQKLGLGVSLTVLLFTVFEAALLLSMWRAKMHMAKFNWPGRFGITAWWIAGLMSMVAATASESLAEVVVRMAIPILVTKLWWDGLIGGAVRKVGSTTSWRWTPRRLLLALGAIEPGERDVQTVHRDRLVDTMTRLEYLRRHGSKRLRTRRASRLTRLSLNADDAMIDEVRQRVGRATWWTVTPLTQAATQPLTHLGDALAARQPAAPATQPGRAISPLTSGDAPDADPATRAAQLVVAQQAKSVRDAARRTGAAEPTVRRRLDAMGWKPPVTQSVTRVNGHKPDAEVIAAAQS